MPKIAIILPSLRGGGAERSMLALANALVKKDFDIDLVLAKKEGVYLDDVNHRVNLCDLGKKRMLSALFPLKKHIKQNKPDFIISAMPHVNIVAFFARVLSRHPAKLIVSERNYLSKPSGFRQKIFMFWLKVLMRFVYKRSYAVTSVSQSVSNQLINELGLYAHKVITVYNPVVNDSLLTQMNQPPTHKWIVGKEAPVILAAGRLTEQKDFSLLIKAFSQVRKQIDARLIIIGEGEERARLLSLVADLGLQNYVDLPGFVSNPFPLMKNADVFVLSSKWEGLPGVLIQAMACGSPVISTDCPGGSREILEDGKWGELVPVGDDGQMAAAIVRILGCETHPDVKERAACYDEEKFVSRFLREVLKL